MSISHRICTEIQAKRDIWASYKQISGKYCESYANRKGVEIIEAEACPDHIHMLVSVPPYLSIAQFMGYLKGKSSLMIFDRHANLKYKYGSRNFWCQRILRRYGREKQKGDCRIYKKPAGRRLRVRIRSASKSTPTRLRVARTSRQKRQPHVSGCL